MALATSNSETPGPRHHLITAASFRIVALQKQMGRRLLAGGLVD
jgi:hypothetical protein